VGLRQRPIVVNPFRRAASHHLNTQTLPSPINHLQTRSGSVICPLPPLSFVLRRGAATAGGRFHPGMIVQMHVMPLAKLRRRREHFRRGHGQEVQQPTRHACRRRARRHDRLRPVGTHSGTGIVDCGVPRLNTFQFQAPVATRPTMDVRQNIILSMGLGGGPEKAPWAGVID